MRHLIFAIILLALASPVWAQDSLRPLTTHVLNLGATSAIMTNPVSSQTSHVRIHADQDAFIAFGASTVAASNTETVGTSMRIVGDVLPEIFKIGRGQYIAVIQDSTAGEIWITEMSP